MKNKVYKHLAFSLSYTLPILVVSGVLFSTGFLFNDAIGDFLIDMGGYAYFLSFVVLAASIAFSIGDRVAIVPALMGGYLLKDGSVGLLGAVVIGLFAGYLTKIVVHSSHRIPRLLQGILPVFIYPVLLTLMTIGLAYLMNQYLSVYVYDLYLFLFYNHHVLIIILSIVFASLMAFDFGGFVNKTVYLIAILSLADGMSSTVLAATIIGGMIPPLTVSVLQLIKPRMSYPYSWWKTGVLGLCFMTEGAIPYIEKKPKTNRIIMMMGSGLAGGIVGFFGITTRIPHGGILITLFMNEWYYFVLALIIGTCLSVILNMIFQPKENH